MLKALSDFINSDTSLGSLFLDDFLNLLHFSLKVLETILQLSQILLEMLVVLEKWVLLCFVLKVVKALFECFQERYQYFALHFWMLNKTLNQLAYEKRHILIFSFV